MELCNRLNDEIEYLQTDVVILCTGLEEALPDCLAPLASRLPRDEDGNLLLNAAFRASLQQANGRKLYLLGTGRYSLGIAEPQMSLSAWRAANVINDLRGHAVYETRQAESCMQWVTSQLPEAAVA